MREPDAVQRGHCGEHLPGEDAHLTAGEASATLLDVVHQVQATTPLHDHMQRVNCVEEVMGFHDVGVLQPTQDLAQRPFGLSRTVLRPSASGRNDLDAQKHILVVAVLAPQRLASVDLAETSLAQQGAHAVEPLELSAVGGASRLARARAGGHVELDFESSLWQLNASAPKQATKKSASNGKRQGQRVPRCRNERLLEERARLLEYLLHGCGSSAEEAAGGKSQVTGDNKGLV
mmetsp:Transcript_89327/g.288800  ORF Transcript_89327/g.288800 Transcript_89327/m.288800 type:complete len:233 (+) Transcript_89327:642-1340(+)